RLFAADHNCERETGGVGEPQNPFKRKASNCDTQVTRRMNTSFQQLAFAYADLPKRRVARHTSARSLADELLGFREFGTKTRQIEIRFERCAGQFRSVPTFVNEFWTARQRQASSLHEVSYRACFKPQLPRFFIERLTQPGDVVYDPFMGRGTTLVEAALLARTPAGNDANPLSIVMTRPRLRPPFL